MNTLAVAARITRAAANAACDQLTRLAAQPRVRAWAGELAHIAHALIVTVVLLTLASFMTVGTERVLELWLAAALGD